MKIFQKDNLLGLGLVFFTAQVFAAESPMMQSEQSLSAQQQVTPETNTIVESDLPSESVSQKSASDEPAIATQEANSAQEEMTGFSRGSVARSIFTTTIDNREPVDKLKQVPNKNNVFYFTELRDMSGQTAKHRWEFKGKVIAEVDFNVRGPRWRVWSKKTFQPGWAGEWKVSVINGAGEVISEEVIAYAEPDNTLELNTQQSSEGNLGVEAEMNAAEPPLAPTNNIATE